VRTAPRATFREAAAVTDGPSTSGKHQKLTTEQWRQLYEKDGTVDLFHQDDFNAGVRIVDGEVVYPNFGVGTGEGKSQGNVPTYKVKISNHYADQEIEVEVPEDRYILWEAEDHGLVLPQSCRMGCCTACAVKVKEGQVYQPEALGVSEELKKRGYALMCVAFPDSDCVLETVPEDEVYDLQFGRYFAQQALDKNATSVERDDFALEIAQMDE
jgi:ferredoxin